MRARSWWLLVMAACSSPPVSAPAETPAHRTATETTTDQPPSETVGQASEAPVATSEPAPEHTPPALPPALPEAGQLVAMKVDGFADAVIAVPAHAQQARPVLVATHGNYDGPEWQCREWKRIAGDEVFILCPRGKARPDSPSPDDTRYTYVSNAALERELDAALDALKARFGDRVDTTAAVYTGFSLGAILGVKIASRRADRYPRLALVEGGFEEWTAARAKAFVAGGGERILFLCGQRACQVTAQHLEKALGELGVEVRVATSPGLGHTYGGPMTELARAELGWLVEGDARWRGDGAR